MNEAFESKPRFKGCPPICEHANLPMFTSVKEAEKFAVNSSMIEWYCDACYHWHAWFASPAPSGETSNSSREQRIPAHIARLAKGQ